MPIKPKVWTKKDFPTPKEMGEYLSRVEAARVPFSSVFAYPTLPADMDKLTFEKANDIERVLLTTHEAIKKVEHSRVYSGELQAGGF